MVAKDPAPRAQMNYGLARMKRGDMAEAERAFREAVRLGPSYHFARINLGIALAARGDAAGARREYDEAVRLAPEDTTPYYWRGLFLARSGDLDGAITDFRRAADLASIPSRELAALADALLRAGHRAEALAAIERGAAIDPAAFVALRARASSPEAGGARVTPIAPTTAAGPAGPDLTAVDALMKTGLDALYRDRDPQRAAAQFRKVLEKVPTHYGATYQLAAALDAAHRPTEARPVWEKVVRMAEGYKDQQTLDAARARLRQTP